MFKLFLYINILAHFGLYTYGETLNFQGELSYLLFTLNNFIFAFLFSIKNKIKQTYILAGLFFIFTLFYGLIRNGLSVDLITDTLQIFNIITLAIVLKNLDNDSILQLIYYLAITSIVAGLYSYLQYGTLGLRFKPVHYIAAIFMYYLWIEKKQKRYLFLLFTCIALILVSGRRTNLLLTFMGILILLLKTKPKYLLLMLLFIPLFFFKDSIIENLTKSEYKTVKRLANGLTKNDESMEIRFAEVNSAIREMNKKPLLNYTFGRGVGATYKLESSFLIRDRRISEKQDETHHIHFSPMNLFFKYGTALILFITYFFFNMLRFFKKGSNVIFLFGLFILMTLIDSLFRSVFVDIFGILFLALGFNKIIKK